MEEGVNEIECGCVMWSGFLRCGMNEQNGVGYEEYLTALEW